MIAVTPLRLSFVSSKTTCIPGFGAPAFEKKRLRDIRGYVLMYASYELVAAFGFSCSRI